MNPQPGQIVRVRSRKYLVEQLGSDLHGRVLVQLACVEDDAQGEPLEVIWSTEIDAQIMDESGWKTVGVRGFDAAHHFSAYLNVMRWSCVTSTNVNLFQAPYRAGIEIKAFQLEPLRKALRMPQINLFIADSVGLGKTIEAGLILQELLMRQKVRRVVICCPPSVVRQWKDEMEERFGLNFMIYDRDYMTGIRQERGYSTNPWTTHSNFIISQALIRNETYGSPLRDWLGTFQSSSMLILDEAHNAAPASSNRYAIDSKLTRAIRELSSHFEHKLFLSATPHNGHSNSFSALLEMLDPQKFCRGVPVHHASRDAIMIRRLKHDLREIGEVFPERKIICIDIKDLPVDAPELALSRLLQCYRDARTESLMTATIKQRVSAMLVVTSLQKRLLSSIEAFARTLAVHSQTMKRHAQQAAAAPLSRNLSLLISPTGADDERADLAESDVSDEEDALMVTTTAATAGSMTAMEIKLLDEMAEIANKARDATDSRVGHLLTWIKQNLCPELGSPGACWNERRVLIFTEYTDTKRYLVQQLKAAIEQSDQCQDRIMTFHGGIGEEGRESIKDAFNSNPRHHPLRILVATDAAREGINLQNHCADLFHFDIPWNPSRLEQRNGRIDRKLQRSLEVRCHYFVVHQRAEDRVLDVLVKKTEVISAELGSLAPVVAQRMDKMLSEGIEHERTGELFNALTQIESNAQVCSTVVQEDLEQVRERKTKLAKQIERLEHMLKVSRDAIGLDERHFRDALSASLEILGTAPLKPQSTEAVTDPSRATWVMPLLHEQITTDPTWARALDALRTPIKKGQSQRDWRAQASIRPLVFRDPGTLDAEFVHLHLEHRLVQRLLGRFRTQGFLHNELTRACVVASDDPVPRAILLARLSLYGAEATRLHDEVFAVVALWKDPLTRNRAKLRPVTETAKQETLQQLNAAFSQQSSAGVPDSVCQRYQAHIAQDVEELQPHLERRAEKLIRSVKSALQARGEQESKDMRKILEGQRDRILKQLKKMQQADQQLTLGFNKQEQRQFNDDQKHWAKRQQALKHEIEDTPARIKRRYQVQAQRVEPIGLVYLCPLSG